MSLIPSESYSFPDHFTRTVVPSRKPKNEEPEPVPLETRRKKSAIVPLLDPEVRPPTAPRLNPEPIRSKTPVAAPNPALRRAGAPPPRIPDACANPRDRDACANTRDRFVERAAEDEIPSIHCLRMRGPGHPAAGCDCRIVVSSH